MLHEGEYPNIILINCDDLGFGDLKCYGSETHKTPHLDRMAMEGLQLTNFYMASSVCSPSRGAMLTGCYPPRIGFGSFNDNLVLFPGDAIGLHPNEFTLSRFLKEFGYSTMHIGKWHCGDQPDFLPTNHGFDDYYGLPYSNDMGMQKDHPKQFPPLPLLHGREIIQEQPDQSSLTERYVEKAIEFIRSCERNPFFLYFGHMHVHLPHYAPARFLKNNENPYAAAVECIDWATGVILHELEKQGIDNNTLVIFTSDNGSRNDFGNSNGMLRGTKNSTWDGGFKVPCLLKWPGKIRSGTVSSELVTSLDLFPTIHAYLSSNEHPGFSNKIDGINVSDVLFSNGKSNRKEFFYYHKNNLMAVRDIKWKLHTRRYIKEKKRYIDITELYNLEEDPGESNNLYPMYPGIVEALTMQIQAMKNILGDDIDGIEGSECRPVGNVAEGVPLTKYDANYPYMYELYDLSDWG